jgi:hypothetical protein
MSTPWLQRVKSPAACQHARSTHEVRTKYSRTHPFKQPPVRRYRSPFSLRILLTSARSTFTPSTDACTALKRNICPTLVQHSSGQSPLHQEYQHAQHAQHVSFGRFNMTAHGAAAGPGQTPWKGRQSSRAQQQGTAAGHSSRAQQQGTAAGHSSRAQQQGTAAGHLRSRLHGHPRRRFVL